MKKTFIPATLFILLSTIMLISFRPAPLSADFSGEWKLNDAKSELGQFANFATRNIKNTQDNETIVIARTAPSFNGDMITTTETLSFDGKQHEMTLFGNSKKKCTASWSEDGKQLVMTYTLSLEFNGEMNEITGKETWSVSDDGKVLTAVNNSSSSFGDLTTKSVYDKQ